MPRNHIYGRFCATLSAMLVLSPIVPSGRLHAQAFRGTLQTTAHGSPVAGAIVLLQDTLHAIAAKGRSDEQGRFVLRPRSRGIFSLRVQRIGMRPYESARFELGADTTSVIALNELPFSLAQVTSNAASACKARSLASAATRQFWEDVRTALIATSLTYAEQRNRFSIAEVRRVYSGYTGVLHSISVQEQAVTAAQPWTSFAPDVLAQHGYVLFADDRLTFVSPDLDVLLSRSFENTHCFDPALTHDGALVGLSFDPGSSLKNNTDIAGTFWLDSASHELRRLTFHHTGLPYILGNSTRESVVRFATFAPDAWFIPEWTIRAPMPGLASLLPTIEQLRVFGDVLAGRDLRHYTWRLAGVNEQRGTVLAVHGTNSSADTSAIWTGATGSIRVEIATGGGANGARIPVPNAEVELVGSTHQQASDGAGVVTFDGLTTGDYKLTVNTLAYTLFSMVPEAAVVHVDAGGVARVAVAVRSAMELRMSHCHDTAQYVIVGSIVHDGAPMRDARLAAYFPSYLNGERVGSIDFSRDDARFVICTKHRGTANTFEVRADHANDLEAAAVVHFAPGERLQAIDLILGPKKEAKPPL